MDAIRRGATPYEDIGRLQELAREAYEFLSFAIDECPGFWGYGDSPYDPSPGETHARLLANYRIYREIYNGSGYDCRPYVDILKSLPLQSRQDAYNAIRCIHDSYSVKWSKYRECIIEYKEEGNDYRPLYQSSDPYIDAERESFIDECFNAFIEAIETYGGYLADVYTILIQWQPDLGRPANDFQGLYEALCSIRDDGGNLGIQLYHPEPNTPEESPVSPFEEKPETTGKGETLPISIRVAVARSLLISAGINTSTTDRTKIAEFVRVLIGANTATAIRNSSIYRRFNDALTSEGEKKARALLREIGLEYKE